MKAKTILTTLLKENVSLEKCGIVTVYETTQYDEFLRLWFFHDLSEDIAKHYHRFIATPGDYFYIWHNEEIRFEYGEIYNEHFLEDEFLYIIPMDDEESEE